MKFLSLFSGIEAASAAWVPLGWSPVAFAEVEPFPCSVLRAHYPHVPNLGDVTKIARQQIEELGSIDLVCGGFPCQDLSVAGKRKGLMNADGSSTRSGLFFTAMRIAEWARARWVVLENVPGMFSSNQGRDFAAVVGEMAGCEFDVPTGGWENAGVAVGQLGLVEWATLDAQYVRVESHPRAVPQRRRRVFIVRDSGDWANRPPLFLERESLRGHPSPRREARESVAGTLSARTKGGSGVDRARGNQPGPAGDEHHNLIPVPFDTTQITSASNYSAPKAGDPCHPLAAGAHAPCIYFPQFLSGTQCASAENVSPSIEALNPMAVATQWAVRRLTPLECERLMGFQDSHTDVLNKGKPVADGPRYKALGNSWAVNCARWIGERIDAVDAIVTQTGPEKSQQPAPDKDLSSPLMGTITDLLARATFGVAAPPPTAPAQRPAPRRPLEAGLARRFLPTPTP